MLNLPANFVQTGITVDSSNVKAMVCVLNSLLFSLLKPFASLSGYKLNDPDRYLTGVCYTCVCIALFSGIHLGERYEENAG
jgi:hypothetical protein